MPASVFSAVTLKSERTTPVGAFRGGHTRPRARVERRSCGSDGAIDIGFPRFGDARDHFFGIGIDDVDGRAGGGGDPLAVDVESLMHLHERASYWGSRDRSITGLNRNVAATGVRCWLDFVTGVEIFTPGWHTS